MEGVPVDTLVWEVPAFVLYTIVAMCRHHSAHSALSHHSSLDTTLRSILTWTIT